MAYETHTRSLEAQLPQILDQARAACQLSGSTSTECAVAWDIVEEIQAAIAHRRVMSTSSLENFCEQSPDAPECRLYDI